MHEAALKFLRFVREQLPTYFDSCRVLDVGAGDINGNNRALFTDCVYEGNDVFAAPNVTVVSPTAKLSFPDGAFDTIISSECFEHDMEYVASMRNIVRMLRPGGLFVFTCASTGRPEHGTRRCEAHSSFTINAFAGSEDEHNKEWCDYYKNLTVADVDAAICLNNTFTVWASYYDPRVKDLYFVGITPPDISPRHPVYVLGRQLRAYPHALLTGGQGVEDTDARTLVQAFNRRAKHHGEAGSNLGVFYERYLCEYKDRNIKVLCVGDVDFAAPLRSYFQNAKVVVGTSAVVERKTWTNVLGVCVEAGNHADIAFWQSLLDKHKDFDVIVHCNTGDQRAGTVPLFELLFPIVNSGGVYVVQDVRDHEQRTHFLARTQINLPTVGMFKDPQLVQKRAGSKLQASIGDVVFAGPSVLVYRELKAHWLL